MAILARDNLLQRVDGFGQVRAVAANITQLLVCLAVTPEPNLFLLDQYLLSAEQQHIDAAILVNKIDLLGSQQDPFDIERIYRPLGYSVVGTSVKSGQGMERFRQMLSNQLSVLSGVSGVGKSSLTHWLLPDETIKIASISEANEEGRHTTRTSRLYHLSGGGELIDTPGVRGFSPFVDRVSTGRVRWRTASGKYSSTRQAVDFITASISTNQNARSWKRFRRLRSSPHATRTTSRYWPRPTPASPQ